MRLTWKGDSNKSRQLATLLKCLNKKRTSPDLLHCSWLPSFFGLPSALFHGFFCPRSQHFLPLSWSVGGWSWPPGLPSESFASLSFSWTSQGPAVPGRGLKQVGPPLLVQDLSFSWVKMRSGRGLTPSPGLPLLTQDLLLQQVIWIPVTALQVMGFLWGVVAGNYLRQERRWVSIRPCERLGSLWSVCLLLGVARN